MQHRPFPFASPLASIVGVTNEPIRCANERAFSALVVRHRAELHGHCLRVLRSPADAEDALQETLLRAWRSRHTFASGAARPWLHRIATNACLDLIARRNLRLASLDDEAYDALEPASAPEQWPDAIVIAQETLELALRAAVRTLPPRQHAALVMRDVLSMSAHETATALGMSVAAANSALQRARSGMRSRLTADRLEWAAG
jgi:RNA polymerase sigma factor (sigma-70 family)